MLSSSDSASPESFRPLRGASHLSPMSGRCGCFAADQQECRPRHLPNAGSPGVGSRSCTARRADRGCRQKGLSLCAPFLLGRRAGRGWEARSLDGVTYDGEPAIPAVSRHAGAVMQPQYFGRCDSTHRRACSIGARGGCAARKRFMVGKASIRSRQAQIDGRVGYIACASGAKPNA
jgi:hypothetical protein